MQRKTGVAMRSWAGVIHAACPQRVKRVDRAVSAIGPVTLRSPTKRVDESIVEKGHNQTKNGARHLCYWAPALTTHSNSEKLRNALQPSATSAIIKSPNGMTQTALFAARPSCS